MKRKQRLDRRTEKRLEQFLKEKRAKLSESMRSAVSQRYAIEATRPADSLVWATETQNDEMQVALMDRQSREVHQIEAAIERLGQHEYGICQDCGEFVGMARLKALPFAQRCTPCQSRVEREMMRGPRPAPAAILVDDEE